MLAERAQSVPGIGEHVIEWEPCPHVAAGVFHRADMPELPPRGTPRVVQGHPTRDQLVDLLGEMRLDLFRQFASEPASRQQLSKPIHASLGAKTRKMPSSMRSKVDISRCRCFAPAGVSL